jgi:hypothetical protein
MATDLTLIDGMFKANTTIVNKAIADVPTDDWFRKPGDDSNHLMWVVGHLIVHRGHVLKLMGHQWDASWAPLFARGAERVADNEYPSSEEMKTSWQQVSADLATAMGNPPDDLLANDAPAGFPSFDGKVSGNVAVLAFHDAYHAGQVSYLRKWLGYGQTVG